jgi:hypothetical protein
VGGCDLRETMLLARTDERTTASCGSAAIIIAAANVNLSTCAGSTYIDAANRAERGGALIYVTPAGYRIERAWPAHVRRAWTPARRAVEPAHE